MTNAVGGNNDDGGSSTTFAAELPPADDASTGAGSLDDDDDDEEEGIVPKCQIWLKFFKCFSFFFNFFGGEMCCYCFVNFSSDIKQSGGQQPQSKKYANGEWIRTNKMI